MTLILPRRFYSGPAAYTKAESSGSTATWDPANTSSYLTLSNENLTVTANTGVQNASQSSGTNGKTSGKYYFEVTVGDSGAKNFGIGIITNLFPRANNYQGSDGASCCYYTTGHRYYNGLDLTLDSYTTGDIIGVALNIATGKVSWSKNGGNWNKVDTDPENASAAVLTSGTTFYPCCNFQGNADASFLVVNFGNSAFTYTPPAGYGNW